MQNNKFQTESGFDSPDGEISRVQKRRPYICSQELLKLSDEELCHNARQGCAASKELLWKRYIDFIRIVVYKENQRQHLPQHEIADALQELYFAFHTTVQRYDPKSHCKGKPASFKTFLGIVIAHQFSKYCGRWRKYHQRVVLNLAGEESQRFIVEAEEDRHVSLFSPDGNDCSSLAWKENLLIELSSNSLATALRQLKSKESDLIAIWLQYGRDKEVARILGISPAAARLRRERLFRHIKRSAVTK